MGIIERSLAKLFKTSMSDYCDLETSRDEFTLVHRDGSLSTFLSLNGSLMAAGPAREKEIVDRLTDRLSGVMGTPGFRIQFVITRDPDANERALKEALSPAAQTAKRIGLSVTPLLAERARVLGDKVAVETSYVIITTQLSLFLPSQLKDAMAERLQVVRDLGVGIKSGEYGQGSFTAVEALVETHNGFITSFEHSLSEFLSLTKIPVKEAIRTLAFSINPSAFHREWQPIMPGDRVPLRAMRESQEASDISHLQYPDIAFQLFPQAPEVSYEDATLVKIGDRYIAPLLVDIPPQKNQSFDDLFQSVPREVPFRFMISVETGHEAIVRKISTKQTIATFLSLTSSTSRQIKQAAQEYLDLVEGGHLLVSTTMNFCTWGADPKVTAARKAILMQAAQSWGGLQVIEERGDPIGAWLGTLPAFTRAPSGNPFPWFIEEAISSLPLSRPASPWSEGAIMFRTLDNKPYPFQPGSSKQTSWVDVVFAPPGFGKSLFLAAQNLGLILSPGQDQLPRIAILDIGYSSSAFVDLVQQALPENKRYQAQAFKLSLSKENAINPFDTPLGCRYPLSVDSGFLSNFMSLVLTPAGATSSVPRLPELVGILIESMYERFSDDGDQPNIYEPGYCQEVDQALQTNAINIAEGSTWWKVVDELFAAHDKHVAAIAQTFAVPMLGDATSVLRGDNKIRDVFGSAKVNGESLIDFLNTMIVSAVREYPLLSSPTCFDTGGARIVAIDLQDVAKSGGDQATKRTAVAYMLARQALCREFYRNKDSLSEIPVKYRAHHAEQIERDAATPKKICMDEFHRTAKTPSVREQALVDIREGRKFAVHVTVLSQLLDDFSDDIIDSANNVWILSKGLSEETTEKIRKRFKPSPDAMRALKRYVTGPGPEGSSLLYIGDVKGQGRIEQVLRLTLGPREIWAYSTTAQDVALRGYVSEKVGLSKALALLSSKFPSGSAQSHMESRALGDGEDAESASLLIRQIGNEVLTNPLIE